MNASFTKCTIFAWSRSSGVCYCREDGVWEYVAQSERVSGCVHTGPGAVNGCIASPAPSPGPAPPTPTPTPPRPPAVSVGSTAGQAGCKAAGNHAVWVAAPVADGIYQIVNDHATLGKLCLTVDGLGSTLKGYTDMAQVLARTCYNTSMPTLLSADIMMMKSQLWRYSRVDVFQQLQSVGLSALNTTTAPMCLTAVPPVPLIQVAAALAVVGADHTSSAGSKDGGSAGGGGAGRLQPDLNPKQQLVDSSITYTSEGEVTINATLHLKANSPTTFVVSVVSSRDAAAVAPPLVSVSAAADALAQASAIPSAVAAQRAEGLAWWSSYWNASAVSLGPGRQLLEGFWYGMNYMAAMQNRAGKQAAGLWGPWIQSDTMNWNGDYTLDYNFQSEYYGACRCDAIFLPPPLFFFFLVDIYIFETRDHWVHYLPPVGSKQANLVYAAVHNFDGTRSTTLPQSRCILVQPS